MKRSGSHSTAADNRSANAECDELERSRLTHGRSRREILALFAAASAAGFFSNSRTALAALPPHPRLYLNSAGFKNLSTLAGSSTFATGLAKSIQSRAAYKYSQPPVSASAFADPVDTFTVVPEILSRAYLYGIANALKPNPNYVARAIQECLTCCSLGTWYPAKFLGVGAMAQYVATVYDWFHASLTAGQIATMRQAVHDKAFVPYQAQLAMQPQPFWLAGGATNWNLVCNGGIGVAALTFSGEVTSAQAILKETLNYIKLGFAYFGPDGGWFEGPAYWELSATYAINFVAAFRSAGLFPGNLLGSPGFSKTGSFITQITGPTGKVFNFGDSDDTNSRVPEVEWLARAFADPLQSYSEITSTSLVEGMNLGWFAANQSPPQTPPNSALFASTNVGVASFRSAFGSQNATWLGIKGGTNGLSHGDLDLGTFCIDALGQRFAMDLGPDSYSLPGYFDFSGPRYQYYRTGSIGQNVLLSGTANQAMNAQAPVLTFNAAAGFSRVVYDLAQAYPGLHQKRGGALISNTHVVISDEVTPSASVQLTWQMHTQAAIAITNNVAKLTLGGKVFYVHILKPATGAALAIASASAPSPQDPNTGVQKLIVKWTAPAGTQRLVVVLGPSATVPAGVVRTALTPLEKW